MSSKAPIIINILLTCVFVGGLSASSFSLGVEKDNKASDAYQLAAAFTSVFSTLTVVSLLTLIILVSSYASNDGLSAYPGPAY